MGRVVIVPRWSGDAASDWYPWLGGVLDEVVEVAPLRPTKDAPEIEPCLDALTPRLDDRTTLVGHSVGCQVAMRALARSGIQVPHLVLVAGWWDVDQPWDTIRPWIETPFDARAVRAGQITVLLSDDDPFTADHVATRQRFESHLGSNLGARVELHAGARHFNAAQAPAVLAALRRDPGLDRA